MTGHSSNRMIVGGNPVAVAGGEIGGLACALALSRKRFPAVVLPQATAFAEAWIGLRVAPNALAVPEALGVGEAKLSSTASISSTPSAVKPLSTSHSIHRFKRGSAILTPSPTGPISSATCFVPAKVPI